MRNSFLGAGLILIYFLCAGAKPVAAQSASATEQLSPGNSSNISAADLHAKLEGVSAELGENPPEARIRDLRDSLPESWHISTPDGDYAISAAPLRSYLSRKSLREARGWIAILQEQLDTSERSENGSSTARIELNRILATSEFASVRPPGALALFRQRASAWLERMLEKLFGGLVGHPLGIEIFFWTLLACAVAFVAFVVYRLLSRGENLNAFQPQSSMVMARSWQEWLRTARQAAERGDFRDAVHAAYWAAIARLEDIEVLPRDRSKTPREYLNLAKEWDAAGARREVQGEDLGDRRFATPLALLTKTFERNWYARHTASQKDFQDSLRQLETIGCPLE